MKKLLLSFLLFPLFAQAQQFTEPQRQNFAIRNLLKNPGAENGKAQITASGGAFSINTTAANIGSGNAAFEWDSSSASQTFSFSSQTIPAGLYSRAGLGYCSFKCASGTCTHTLQAFDGTNILASQTITSTATYSRSSINFGFPGSGSIVLRVVSVNANEPDLYIDDCYIGDATNIFQGAQTQLIGSAYYASTASCTQTLTGSSITSFGTTSQCPGPTVEFGGNGGWAIQTTDANSVTVLTVNNLPAGNYVVMNYLPSMSGSANAGSAYQMTDGTTPSVMTYGEVPASSINISTTVFGYFNYTAAGNRTFETKGAVGSGTLTLDNGTGGGISGSRQSRWLIYRYPNAADTLFRPDQTANAWSGFHDGTCSWARASTSLGDPTADTTCVFTENTNNNFGTVTSYLSGSDKLPGIVFTPSRAGTYYVCGIMGAQISAANSTNFELSDLTPTVLALQTYATASTGASFPVVLCGLYKATSTASVTIRVRTAEESSGTVTLKPNSTTGHAIDWAIFQVDQNLPMPLIVNSVTSSNSTGIEVINRANITNSGSAAIGSQSGSWLTSATRNAAGNVTLAIAAGIFSATPSCTCTASGNIATHFYVCTVDTATTPSSTAYRFLVRDDTDSGSDQNFSVVCMGPK